jgi:hypothetical protein
MGDSLNGIGDCPIANLFHEAAARSNLFFRTRFHSDHQTNPAYLDYTREAYLYLAILLVAM